MSWESVGLDNAYAYLEEHILLLGGLPVSVSISIASRDVQTMYEPIR